MNTNKDKNKTIDIWSLGCVMGELFLTTPLFQGERSVDQLVEIIKVLGTPTRREIMAMNPNYTYTNFPAVKALPWNIVFEGVLYENHPVPDDAIDILSKFLVFVPSERLDPFDALGHPYFDELRKPDLEFSKPFSKKKNSIHICILFVFDIKGCVGYGETKRINKIKKKRIPGCKKGPNLFNFTDSEIELATRRKIVHTIVPKKYWDQYGIKSKKHSTINTNATNALNGTNDGKAAAKPGAPSSVNSQQDYVLSRVMEIAEQRQEQEKKIASNKKSASGQ
ncbi:glycogen synthase kinase 3 [Reticulomyxa filosa]|uniref:Glycogen synthase kinase 3 n=1 Tax=Reticulomyxa filosa TaxID=46433 RepID=X6NF43_RETFI|nr:glycogen synthase kinase 3 [Reticulomyxa filosa]|eukprot:ETO24920.1 glycogen synthase kinase 3 [Reticulomyxa filosa]